MRTYDISIDETRGELRRMIATMCCSIALAFNILCGIVLSLGASPTSLATRALENGWTIICSAGGTIVVDADGNRVTDDPAGHAGSSGPHCVFCLPLMHGDVALAGVTTTPSSAVETVLRHSLSRTDAPVVRFSSTQAWPRAPPSSLIG